MNIESNCLLSAEPTDNMKNSNAKTDYLEVDNKDEDKLADNEINQKDVSINFYKDKIEHEQ